MLLTKEKLYSTKNSMTCDDIIQTDVYHFEQEKLIKVKFISSNSSRNQGIVFVANNGICLEGKLKQKTIIIWENEHSSEFTLSCSQGVLNIFNVWEEERMLGYHQSHSGMRLMKEKDLYIYSCNDFSINGDFTSIVFSVQII
ncbi:hypothetical protein CHN50_11805 [Priestia aryabhattai]|uniref:hypothetical protein n=1 Tax=Priestia TaxID=2800373 RepID=UPI000BA05415|nr:hypothetical protein [Priestia flexa]MDT2047698.1 hypothetical protein [Priestia flexa]OZT12581.1 hypothetical protein CHN50_11805 [Priestia aryabhattai]USY56189.1 hypothetical protein NIZ91_05920 [Bacillus sp. 1780r2a1]